MHYKHACPTQSLDFRQGDSIFPADIADIRRKIKRNSAHSAGICFTGFPPILNPFTSLRGSNRSNKIRLGSYGDRSNLSVPFNKNSVLSLAGQSILGVCWFINI